MFTVPDTIVQWALIISTFMLVLLLWGGAVWVWSLRRALRTQKVGQRLGLVETTDTSARELRLWHDGQEATTSVPGQAGRASLPARMGQLVEEAGWDVPVRSGVLGVLGVTLLAFLLTFVLTGRPLAGAGVAVALVMIFWAYLKQRISRRAAVFERQFVDALELAARSLRAGHPLIGGLHLVSDEVPAPVGTIFTEVCQQQAMGVSLADALRGAAKTHPGPDMQLFATSVIIQLESGGNLADMMERLAVVIRERMKLSRHARVLTAQTQLSKRMLILLPFVLFVVLNLLDPEYMQPLYNTSVGRMLLAGAGISILIGMWIMKRMIVLKF